MKIFISWSGARSRAIAEALNDWLKRVIQAVKPFYSPEIEKGAKWSSEIDAALEGTRFGIICLTPDNLENRWIHYEAGALSKTPEVVIWTFLHGLNPGDVPQPLGRFQHTVAAKDDVLRLLGSINKRLADVGGEPIDNAVLSENFELYWPKLEEKLKQAEKDKVAQTQAEHGAVIEKPRDEREILLEILEMVRSQQRSDTPIKGYWLDGTDANNIAPEHLSDRELQVLRLTASGQSITRIAEELKLSAKTVNTYRSRLLLKLAMKTNAELVRYAIQNGLVDWDNIG
jgi:DNA-binding CsgD family transcriptional regulator